MIALRMVFVSLVVLLAFAASAAPAPSLTAAINELAPRTRRAAPDWIDVTLRSRSTALREGALEFTMLEWGETIYRYRTHDLVINSGDQTFRFLLPAATATGTNSDRTIELRLIEKSGVTPIGTYPMMSRLNNRRAHVIAVIRPAYRNVGSEINPVWQALRLERFASKDNPEFDTTPIFFDPLEIPNDPLGFCAFDLVLIEREAFGKMREKSRAALFQWVNAGGSLCVMANDGLEQSAVDAINSLAAVDPRWKPITLDNAGQLQVPGGLALARTNFGRLAVATELPKDDPEQVSPLWRRACGFLWKMRTEQAAIVEAEGKWNLPKELRAQGEGLFVPGPPLKELMPTSVRLLPLWVLVGLLGLFVAFIGPGDWFLLGALKRHRFTWLLLPLVAVLITAVTVLAAQRFMGRGTRQRSLIISDLGVSGRVIRETHIDLELPARERIAVTASTSVLRVPVEPSYHRQRGNIGEAWNDMEYRGQYPTRYEFIRPQRQWSPQLTRVSTICDGPDTSGVRWDAFDAKRIAGRWSGYLGPEMSPGVPCSFDFFSRSEGRFTGDGPIPSEWRQSITAMSEKGLGVLLTQESPSGFATLDDLPFFETRDATRTVLIATKNEGENIHIWRRLYLH